MDHKTIKKEYCQSCGMPLRFDVEEYLGTNADQSHSDEYCYYCLKDGEYTVDIPMSEMVDIWVKYTDKYNEYSTTQYNANELRILLNKRLPTLKRWKQKYTTENVHYKAVNEIKSYIDQHLEKEIDTKDLCSIANLSYFHLRRIFRNITGENIGTYIQRLRLEKVAHKLVSTSSPIHSILKDSCYQTKASLAKAFKKHFGISMSDYRKQNAANRQHEHESGCRVLRPAIKKLRPQKAICYPVDHVFRNKNEYLNSWKKLFHYKEKHMEHEHNVQAISISMDNPQITSPEQCRFYLGLLTTGEHKTEGKLCMQELPQGMYAVFLHKGNYAALPDLYKSIYEEWLPQNGYVQENPMSFEIYLNSPRTTETTELLTEVYIPIRKNLF